MLKAITLLTCYFLWGIMHLSGQIIIDSVPYKLTLVDNKSIKMLRADRKTTFENISQQTVWNTYNSIDKAPLDKAIWLKFEIENRSQDTVGTSLFSPNDYTTIYQQTDQGYKILKNGFYVPLSERANQSEPSFTKLNFLPFQKSQLYVRLDSNSSLFSPNIPELYSEIGYWEQVMTIYKKQEKSIGFIYFHIISIATILIFALIFWLRLRKKLYLYYLGYLFFQLIYGFLVLRFTLAPVGNFFVRTPRLAFNLFEPVQFIFIGFYVFFILQLLQVKNYDKLLAKILKYLGIFCFIYAGISFISNYFLIDFKYTGLVFLIIRSIILPLNFILIFWIIYKVKHPLIIYFIIGQSFFFIGALLSTYIAFSGIQFTPGHLLNFKAAPNIIFQLGLLAEVYCFSLALGKNVFLLQKKKEITDAELIDQLKENHQIQERMNRELDKKVNEKTYELLQLYSKIEREREQKTKDDFTQKLRETEIVALRSQMNPHFIFNSMNAIKSLIMSARNESAVDYLDDFSSLLRGILQNSNRKKITVEEELEILELYLSLEKSRMGENFHYHIEVDSKEALSQHEIPPLLLQPIVENAIWHGLQPSLKAKKTLTITFDTSKNLKIIIEDNGIGRKESSKKKKLHDSMGTTIVKDRLSLHNHLNDHAIHLKITDLEEEGTASGTRITLTYDY